MNRKQVLLLLLALCIALAVAATWYLPSPQATTQRKVDSTLGSSSDLPVLWDAPEFDFADQRGGRLTNAVLRGRPWIADFMFTQCTSVCPTLTAKLVLLQARLTDAELRFVSFSVDPKHDDVATLAKYAAEWNAREMRWSLCATTPRELQRIADAFRVGIEATGDVENPILHSDAFILVDARGAVRGMYSSSDVESVARLEADVRRLGVSPGEPTALAAAASRSGAELFRDLGCVTCHTDSRLAPPLDGIAGSQVQLAHGDSITADTTYLRESILRPAERLVNGYGPTMPAYEAQISADQVERLVEYVNSLPPKAGAAEPAPELTIDPVCDMQVTVTPKTPHAEFRGKPYYFCSEACRQAFEKDPSAHVNQ